MESHQEEQSLYIYVVGGRNRGKTVAVVERFSVAEHRWERCPSLSVSRGSHGVVAAGGKIYAVAGGGINSNLTSCEVFDPVTNSWSHIASLNTARHALAAAAGAGEGKIYAVGGWVNGNHCSGETELYDFKRDLWVQCGAMQVPRRLHGLAELNGSLFAFGGIGAHNEFEPVKDAERYNPKTNEWIRIAPLPEGSYASCCSSGKYVYVFLWGRRVWRYCPKTNTYLDKSKLPLKEWYGFAVTAWGSKIYVIGGSTEGRWTGAAYIYDTEADTWAELPPMKIVRRRTGAAACCHFHCSKQNLAAMENLENGEVTINEGAVSGISRGTKTESHAGLGMVADGAAGTGRLPSDNKDTFSKQQQEEGEDGGVSVAEDVTKCWASWVSGIIGFFRGNGCQPGTN